jgi:hypothetical protein
MLLPEIVSLTKLGSLHRVQAVAIVRWFGKRYYYLVDGLWCQASGRPATALPARALEREYSSMERAREIHRVLTKGAQS